MKQDTIQHLLEKYREGTLTDAELDELNSMTHRDEVFAAADRRAGGILIRRAAGRAGLGLAAVALLGAGIWMMRPQAGQEVHVAENVPAQALAPDTIRALPQESTYQGRRGEEEGASKLLASNGFGISKKASPNAIAVKSVPPAANPVVKTTQTVVRQEVESVVTCNNQCEADSVISDIWKFLSA